MDCFAFAYPKFSAIYETRALPPDQNAQLLLRELLVIKFKIAFVRGRDGGWCNRGSTRS